MGYDLHATRAEHWMSSAGFEITEDEWLTLHDADPELQRDPENGPRSVVWTSGEGVERGWFDWFEGVVYTTDPDPATVGKLLELAERLNARVQGDGGEIITSVDQWEARL